MNNMKKGREEQELESEDIYLDTNIFIYSVLNENELGEKARKILEKIKTNNINGFTSVLTIDEIIWAIQKELGKEKSANLAEGFISMQNLEFIPANIDIIKKSLNYYKNSLDPRDAIHVASMQSKNIKTIYSTDSDFDKIKSIKRIDFSK